MKKTILISFLLLIFTLQINAQNESEYDYVRAEIMYRDSVDNEPDTASRFWTDSTDTFKKGTYLDTDKPFFRWFRMTIVNDSDSTLLYSFESDFPTNKTFAIKSGETETLEKRSVINFTNVYIKKDSDFGGMIGYRLKVVGY